MNRMEKKQIILTINVLYVLWFIVSFVSLVMAHPLSLLDNSSINITDIFSSVYNFSALAICGILIAVIMERKD